MGDVSDFFSAKTFAVVGASRDEKKVGNAIFKNLLQSGRKVFPVNPNAKEIFGHRCYEDLLEVPYEIDCVVVAVPAKLVTLILRHCQSKKVKCVIITSAGFAENGNSELEKRILQIAEESGMKILGPNSFGIIDVHNKMNSTYFSKLPAKGKIAFISQSGAIGSAVIDSLEKLSGFVSVGNSMQTDFSDFIEYYSKDKNTDVIALYLESLKEGKGQKFIEVCRKCKKPIFVLKSGKSKKGQEAAKSHTAALASEKGVYSGIFAQSGVVETNSIKQLFDSANIKEKYSSFGNRAAIITNAGGLGVLTTDECEENKIKLFSPSEKTVQMLKKINPNGNNKNPFDLLGDASAEDYASAIKILEKEEADFFIVLLTPQKMSEPLQTAKILQFLKKPVFACFVGGEQVLEAKNFMKNEIINFDDVKEMCEAIGKQF